MHKKFAIGIVTYHPDAQRLKENIAAASAQPEAGEILIADNDKGENTGIAGGLNQIFRRAEEHGYEWVVTLDQDSVMQPGMLSELALYTDKSDIGIICPRIEDRNMGRQYARSDHGTEYIEHCITAGNLVRVEAWKTVGGFDEEMFIDGVDFDFCIRIRQNGYKILRTNNVMLLQEVGHGRAIKLPLGKQISIINHPPLRLYYIARNYLYIGKRHKQFAHWAIEVIKRMFIVFCFEDNRKEKIRSMMTGIRHYQKGIMGMKSE